jgi:sugar lactone lactonase YvrE
VKTKSVVAVGSILAMLFTLAWYAGAARAQGGGTTVAEGFNGPMGVLVAPDGGIWVIDSGVGGEADLPFVDPQTGDEITAKFGESAQIVQIAPDGTQTVAATLPSVVTGMDTIGGARLALLNGSLYATSGQLMGDPSSVPTANTAAVVKIEDGQVSEVANTWDLESSQNPDGFIYDSHPYGLAAGPDGYLWVADAAANDLLKIDPASGEIEVVTVFDGIVGPLPNPSRGDAMESDPVPTGITFDQEGTIYVSFLAGFPFLPGSAKVVQVSSDGQVTDYATGLTMLTDLRSAPDGNMYAVQFGEFTEQGPTPNSGKIIRVAAGDASEEVLTGLSFPTSIDFSANGDAYVTINGVGAPGSGEVVMFPGLAAAALSTEEAPPTLPTSGADLSGSERTSAGLLLLGFLLVGSGLFLESMRAFFSQRLGR